MLPFPIGRIVENFPLQGFDDFFFLLCSWLVPCSPYRPCRKSSGACQASTGGQRYGGVYLLESYRFTHNVGFEDVPADLHFYREHLRTEAVEQDKLLVVVVVEKSPFGNKSVV